MKAADVATVIISFCAVLGLIVAGIAWFFRRGGDERETEVAQGALLKGLSDNTSATRELTFEFRDFKDQVVEKLHGLDIRVTRLEVAPPPIHVTTKVEAPPDATAPSDRNSGPY